jgi:hypothetical protein
VDGFPRVSIDGEAHVPVFLTLNTDLLSDWAVLDSELSAAASAGVRIISFMSGFASWFRTGAGGWNFNVPVPPSVVQLIDHIVLVHPKAVFIPRVGMYGISTELVTISDAAGKRTICPFDAITDDYIADGSKILEAGLSLLDATFPGRFIGVHLSALHTGEWFFPNSCPGDGPGNAAGFAGYSNFTRESFCRRPGATKDCDVPTVVQRTAPTVGNTFVAAEPAQFNLWMSDRVVEAITAFSRAIKAVTEGKALAGAFYGYL